MIKKILKITMIVLTIIFIKLSLDIIINQIVINKYNNQNYDSKLVKALYILNINQPYLPYYNEGTIKYQLKEYDEAIELFNKSLEHKPDKDHVCDIRINLALSMIANIKTNDKKTTINELEKARKVLYEDNCAKEGHKSGNSEDADKLEEKIKEKEDELKNNNSDPDDDNNDPDDGGNNNQDPDIDENEIEEKLKEQQKEALEQRKEDEERNENNYNFSYEENRW